MLYSRNLEYSDCTPDINRIRHALYRIATEGRVWMRKKYDRTKRSARRLAVQRNRGTLTQRILTNYRCFKCQCYIFDKYWSVKLITIVCLLSIMSVPKQPKNSKPMSEDMRLKFNIACAIYFERVYLIRYAYYY